MSDRKKETSDKKQEIPAPRIDGANENTGTIPYDVLQNGLTMRAKYADFHPLEQVSFVIAPDIGLAIEDKLIVPSPAPTEIVHGFRSDLVLPLAGQRITISFTLISRQPPPRSATREYLVESASKKHR